MNTPKGGRGKKAPYQTTTIRVPVPLQSEFEARINEYCEFVVSGTQPPVKLDEALNLTKVSYSEAVAYAEDILKQKKSARKSIEKLLQVLYGGETNLKD